MAYTYPFTTPRVESLFTQQKQEIDPVGQYVGIAHFAISLGSKEAVVSLTEQLWSDGYRVISGPRTTGDGYFKSVIMDPDGNSIEITL